MGGGMKRNAAFVLTVLLLAMPAAARYGVKKTIPLGATGTYPHSLAFNPIHNKVYCSNTGSGSISVIDAFLDSLLANVPVIQPGEMVYAQGSDRLFVHDINTELWALSGSGDSVEAFTSFGQGWCELAYNPLQDRLYVSNGTDGLAFFTSSTLAYLGSNAAVNGNVFFAEPLQKLYGVAGLQVYVLDGASNAVIDSFAVTGIEGNSLFAYNPAVQKLYVTTAQGDLCVVNALNDDVITMLPLGASPVGMAYCPLNNAVYAALGNGELVEVLPDEMYNVFSTGSIQLAGVVYNPVDSLIYTMDYIMSKGPNMMMLFDPSTQTFRDSVIISGSNMYTNLVADNQGDVYTADYMQDQAYAVGRVPNTAWRSNPMGGYGSWHIFGDWEVYDSLAGWIPNPYGTTPSATDSIILIQAGDTMAVDGDITVDELSVDGMLLHNGGQIAVNNGPGVDILVNGTFSQGMGTYFNQMPGSQWAYGPGAKHEFMGGDVDPLPIAFWDSTSTLHVVSVGLATSFAGGTGGQQFGDILWSAPTVGTFTLASGPGFGCRDLQIDTGSVEICSSVNSKVTVNNYTQNNGSVWVRTIPGAELEVAGDYRLNGGVFQMGGAGGGDTLRLRGSLHHNAGYMYGYLTVNSANVIFDGDAEQSYAFNELLAHTSERIEYRVMPGSFLYVGSNLGAGNPGTFTLSPGAVLGSADILGFWQTADSGAIRCTGGRTYGPGAGFVFGGGAGPGVSGDAVAGNVSMIRAANPLGTTLTASVTLSDSLLLEGPLATGTDTIFLGAGASTSMLGGQVEGNLAKYFPAGSEYRDFEVGTAGGQYSPVGLQLYNSTQPGYVTVSAQSGPHPMVDSMDQCLRRYWRISAPGIGFDNSQLTLNYLPGDFNSAFFEALHESAMAAGRYGNGAVPGWTLPAVLGRMYNGPSDGGSITLAGGSSFDDSPEFTTGRDASSIHAIQDTVPPAPPESLQIYGFNPSYWLSGLTTSVPVGWINPYDSTGIARAFYKTYTPPSGPLDLTDSILVVGGARDTFWLPVDTLNGTMPVYLWLRDGAGNSSYINTGSIIARRDTVAPAGAAVKPFPTDTSHAVNFAVNWSPGSDSLSGIQAWRVLSRIDTSAAWDTLAPFTNDTSIAFSGALVGHRYYFEAAACDSAYNWELLTGTPEASIFVAQPEGDTIPPYIVSTFPANGATGVATDAAVSIQFSEPIRASLFSYSFEPAVGGLSANWSADSTSVNIGHDPLAPMTSYLVSIAAAPDTMGLPLNGPSSFSFTTVSLADTVTPYIVSASPADGDTGVVVSAPVTVTFSEPVDTLSLRFTCSPDPGSWSQTWSGAQTAVLGHAPFAIGTSYTFSVDSVADPAGNTLDTLAAPNLPWSFATVAPATMATSWGGGAWRLWSVPMMPQDTSSLATLGDDLGAYSDTTWRMLGYKPNFGYIDHPALASGYGYWLASIRGATIDVQGARLSGMQTVALDSGWNMVGDPFDFPVSLAGLKVRWNDGSGHELPFGDSLVNAVLRQWMWQYVDNSADLVNNGYWDSLDPARATDSIRPWQGYAVYATRSCTLVVEPEFKTGVGTRPGREILWQLELSAFMGAWADRGLKIGVSPQAAQGYDRLDTEKPPLAGDRLAVHLPHHDWGQGPCHSYMRDFRPPGSEQRWEIRVDAAERLPVAVDITLEGGLDPQYHLYIVNKRLGQAQEVSGSGRVVLDGGGELEVVYTRRGLAELDLQPLSFGLTRIHPNPFRGRAVVDYQMERPGRVSLRVYNSLGQLAAVLVDGHREAGFHAAVWDGRRAAAGVYLVRLESEGRTMVTKTVKLR